MPEQYQPGVLILAAGASRRFNGVKQLAEAGNKQLLARLLEVVCQLPGEEKLCVLGANAQVIKQNISIKPEVRVCECPEWEKGLSASIAFGVGQLLHCSHILLLLADQPDIGECHLRLLLDESTKYPDKVIGAFYLNRNGAPAIFPKRFFPMLKALTGDRGAGQFLNQPEQQDHIRSIVLEEAAMDIDTQEDLAKWNDNRQ